MKQFAILLIAFSLLSVACSAIDRGSQNEVTGTIIDVSYFGTAGAGNVTAITVEEQDGTKHSLGTSGTRELFKEGQQIRVVFKEGGRYPSENSSSNSVEEVEENGVIKMVKVYWWTIIEYEILS